jgi:hypothetical protein
MERMKLTCLMGLLWIGAYHSFADIPAATVTQAYHKVTHADSESGKGESAQAGTALRDGEYLKTGKASLAEMELANKTITRLGPDTRFAYSAATQEADLQSGTILFSKPKDGKALTIKMATVAATVTGTTGFMEKQGGIVVVGVIEGTVHLTVGGLKTVLQAGQMLASTAGSNPQIVFFDVPNFVGTSAFFQRFQRPLPNEKYVEREISEYRDLVSRGFIEPAKVTLASAGSQEVGIVGRIAEHDVAGNSFQSPNHAGSSVADTNSSGGGLTINGSSFSGGTLAGGSSGTLIVNGNGGSSSGGTFNVNGSGAGVTSSGGGTLTLTGGNSYTGGTISGSGNTNTGDGVLSVGNGTTGGTLTGGTNTGGSITGIISGTTIGGTNGGVLNLSGSGTINLNSGTGNLVGTGTSGTLGGAPTPITHVGNGA